MNQPKQVLKIAFICLLGFMMATCQKQDLNSDSGTELKSRSVTLSSTSNYLQDLIGTIEQMFNDGLLDQGNANALIVKINNAIKSIAKGNINASDGQLNAFINETEEFIDAGIIAMEDGRELVVKAENAIAVLNGNNFSLVNTTWDFTVNWSVNVSWHADVTFKADGTTIYDEPEYPGIYTMYGTWSLNGNVLDYIMDSSGSMGSNYHFTGTLSGYQMNGTFTLGNGTRTWSATLK